MRFTRFLAGAVWSLSVAVAGCGGGKQPAAPQAVAASAGVKAPEPSTTAVTAASTGAVGTSSLTVTQGPAETAQFAPLPANLTCDGDPTRPAIAAPAADPSAPIHAGQMTEEAAQAKRLFDSEKWAEAHAALSRVVRGDTGDDEGNKQLAGYQVAITLFRMKRLEECYTAFRRIAERRAHLKHKETQLWLAKIAAMQPSLIDIAVFANYKPEDFARFDNDLQRELYETLSYLVGRERLQQGAWAEARELLSHVSERHPYGAHGRKCADFAQKRTVNR